MKIKKIKKLSNNKYKIEFEDAVSLITYDNVILENNILLKKEIDIDTYMKISNQNGYYQIYSKAVKYIVTKLRSEKEIREYIKRYTEGKELTDKIVNQLKTEGLLNDERYVKAFIEDKVNLTSWGPYKIEKELEKLDMNGELVRDTLAKYDTEVFEQKIQKIIAKKEKLSKKDSTYMLKQKLERELFDLGYPRDMIREQISSLSVDEVPAIQKELAKLHKKLSVKYSNQNLYYQLKQKLLQKGFSVDSINEALEEYQDI